MKKIISSVVVVLLLLGIMAFAVTAGSPDPVLTVGTVMAKAGETVNVVVSITEIECASYELVVEYAEGLTLKKVTRGSQYLGMFTSNKDTGKIVDFTSSDTYLEGDLFVLTFDVAANAPDGLLEVDVNLKGFYNANQEKLNVEIVSGGVQVYSHIPGDVVYENFSQSNGETYCDQVVYCTLCNEELSRVRAPYLCVTVGTAQDDPGATVRVPVSVSVAQYASYELAVKYDEALTLTKIEKGSQYLGFFTGNEDTGKVLDFTSSDVEVEGDIFWLTFEIAESVPAGTQLDVSVEIKGFYKASGEAFAVEVVSGGVIAHAHAYEAKVTAPTCENAGYTTYTCRCGDSYVADHTEPLGHAPAAAVEENRHYEDGVCCADSVVYCSRCKTKLSSEKVELYLLGDVNNDGEVSVLDAMIVAQYIVGDIGDDRILWDAANVNGDEEISVLDAMVIAQYIVGDISKFPAEQ